MFMFRLLAGNKTSRGMGPYGDHKACWDHLAGQKHRFDFENGCSVPPNDPSMLCGHLMDPFLYLFRYQLIG